LESVEGVQQIFLRKRNEECAQNATCLPVCHVLSGS